MFFCFLPLQEKVQKDFSYGVYKDYSNSDKNLNLLCLQTSLSEYIKYHQFNLGGAVLQGTSINSNVHMQTFSSKGIMIYSLYIYTLDCSRCQCIKHCVAGVLQYTSTWSSAIQKINWSYMGIARYNLTLQRGISCSDTGNLLYITVVIIGCPPPYGGDIDYRFH